jgi:UPF0716 family protein affecting phage T7 exclusion
MAVFFGNPIGEAIATVFPWVGGAIGGIILVAVALFIFILGVFWLIFPWMVYSMLKNLQEELKRIETNTRHKDYHHNLTAHDLNLAAGMLTLARANLIWHGR